MPVEGCCHCGAVTYLYDYEPDKATSCNCSICRRLGALWIYAPVDKISVSGPTRSYIQGDKLLAFHSCEICGCTTHWENLQPELEDAPYMAVNLRLAAPEVVAKVRVRHFDGADSWTFFD